MSLLRSDIYVILGEFELKITGKKAHFLVKILFFLLVQRGGLDFRNDKKKTHKKTGLKDM